MIRLAILPLLLAGCTTAPLPERTGRVLRAAVPQAVEQCRAQPQLEWCRP